MITIKKADHLTKRLEKTDKKISTAKETATVSARLTRSAILFGHKGIYG